MIARNRTAQRAGILLRAFRALAGIALPSLASCAPERTESSAQATTECPGPATLEGIDVSSWQGHIDWPSVAASGRAFAVARVSDGFYVDPDFDYNYGQIHA